MWMPAPILGEVNRMAAKWLETVVIGADWLELAVDWSMRLLAVDWSMEKYYVFLDHARLYSGPND